MPAMSARFSFEVVDAVDYDELRPNYAAEAIDWVVERGGLAAHSTVVDLAAGTGQLAWAFARLGVDVVAIEPAANMRAVLQERVQTIRVIDGAAESIPLDDSSVDAVVVGNAFHHFDRDRAFAAIARVLRARSVLALYWAWPLEERFLRYPGLTKIEEIVESIRASSDIATAYRVWSEPPDTAEGFGLFDRREFPVTHVIPSRRLADLYATSSDVASLPGARRAHLLDSVRELSRGLPETLRIPGRTVVDLCHRN
jgi:SAM-dependent methyltransferase